MTYQLADGWTSVKFVRPAHGLVALHGPRVLPIAALGLEAGRTTHGHRFEALRPTRLAQPTRPRVKRRQGARARASLRAQALDEDAPFHDDPLPW